MHSRQMLEPKREDEWLMQKNQLEPKLRVLKIGKEVYVNSNTLISDDYLLQNAEFAPPLRIEGPGRHCSFDLSKQLVVYDPGRTLAASPAAKRTSSCIHSHIGSSGRGCSRRAFHSKAALVAQCALCLKWRRIPTMKQYEAIRANSTQDPFICEKAKQWNRNISCNDAGDIEPDGSVTWGLDRQNIPVAPPGWERLVPFRKFGGIRIADVYYRTPTGKKLRSYIEVQRFLLENPHYLHAGINMTQFSFKIPKLLDFSVWNSEY